MSFRIGQMVVCVDDKNRSGYWAAASVLTKGRIYTIRGFDLSPQPGGPQPPGIYLEEITMPQVPWCGTMVELSFLHDRFRPVKETSIEIFRKLIAPIPADA